MINIWPFLWWTIIVTPFEVIVNLTQLPPTPQLGFAHVTDISVLAGTIWLEKGCLRQWRSESVARAVNGSYEWCTCQFIFPWETSLFRVDAVRRRCHHSEWVVWAVILGHKVLGVTPQTNKKHPFKATLLFLQFGVALWVQARFKRSRWRKEKTSGTHPHSAS